jgi:uncharacterized integral membrane protein
MTELTHGGGGSYKAKYITLGIVFALVVTILIQNSNSVTFRFLFWSAQVSQLILIIAVLAIGFVGGLLTGMMRRKSN